MISARGMRLNRVLLAATFGFTYGLAAVAQLQASDREQLAPGQTTNWVMPEFPRGERACIVTTDRTQGATNASMITALFGALPPGVTIVGIVYTGHATAGGTFTGGTAGAPPPMGPIRIPSGVILASGPIAWVKGGPAPNYNQRGSTSTSLCPAGDADLDAIGPPPATADAAVFEFDITSTTFRILGFRYVFGSEEYNEWVWSGFNDRCAIFLNPPLPGGRNLAEMRFSRLWLAPIFMRKRA